MLARTTTTTFLMPFPIGNTRRELPAASYVVEADEELLHTLSLLAHRRVATILRAPRLRGSSDLLDAVSIGAAELETALREMCAVSTNTKPKNRSMEGMSDEHAYA